MKSIKLYLFQALITLILIEIVFRLFGYQAYSVQKYTLTSTPSQCILPDEKLGFQLNDGTFQVVINDSVKYSVTHVDNQRITSYNQHSDTAQIWLFGGSFPYGMGVDDSLAYPFLTQQNFPNFKVKSYCVPGFGMVQSLLQMPELLKKDTIKPKKIILHYASFYEDRNLLTPAYRVSLHHGFMNSSKEARHFYEKARYPYIKLKRRYGFEMKSERLDQLYQNWWGRSYFATVNFFQTFEDNSKMTDEEKSSSSQEIIERFRRYCRLSKIKLIVATITNDAATDELKEFCKERKIKLVDLFVDFSDPNFSNLPYDSHPNAKAHQIYADKMKAFLANQ